MITEYAVPSLALNYHSKKYQIIYESVYIVIFVYMREKQILILGGMLVLMFEPHRLTNRFPIYRIMPELRCILKNDDRTPILFKREVCCGRRKDKALELVTYILLKCY